MLQAADELPSGPRRVTLTPELRARIVELHRERPALSEKQIGGLLGVSGGTVNNVLRHVRAMAMTGGGGEAQDGAAAAAEDVADEPGTPLERAERHARWLLRGAEALRRGGDVKGGAAIQDRTVKVLEQLHALRPPVQEDPSADPVNVGAREEVVRRVGALIAREEENRGLLADLERSLVGAAAARGTA